MAKRKLKVRKPPSARDDTADPGGALGLDVLAHGPLREMIERFRSRLLQEAAATAANRSIDANDLERAYASLLCQTGSGDWEVSNRRRVYLIQKQLAGDILPEEVDELRALQANADQRMSEVAPRPLEMLWEFKRKLKGP